jgi:CBS domain-containing protein
MIAVTKPLLSLTAADLMSAAVVTIPADMSLQGAARALSKSHISGAPVVDADGRCVGVLSSTDFLSWAGDGPGPARHGPACMCSDWDLPDPAQVPADVVRNYMTADPVFVSPAARVGELSQMMLDAHIHRVIVVDAVGRPVGVVTSTDVLAAVAYAERAGHAGRSVHHTANWIERG